MGPPQPNIPLASAKRIHVHIDYLDGTEEDMEAAEMLQLGVPGLLLVPLPRDAFIGVNLATVKRWEATPSGLAVVHGAN